MIKTKATGIFQSDLIIRSAIQAGLFEIRQKPYLLDYCFASLPQDELTASDYGDQDIEQAKRWFLSTDIPVVFNRRLGEVQFPCITIALLKSAEVKNTLGDSNYEHREETVLPTGWPNLTTPFIPISYDRASGLLVVPDAVPSELILTVGQVLVTRKGTKYPIIEVVERNKVLISPNINEELNGSVFRGSVPPTLLMFGSARFAETYALGVHVQSEPIHLTYLHSILTFVLLRKRKELIEGRGFEVTALDSGDFSLARYFEGVEGQPVYTRFISISGEVLQWWVESEDDRIATALSRPKVSGAGSILPPGDTTSPVAGDEDEDLEDIDFFVKPPK